MISGLTQGFGTYYLGFTSTVAAAHTRLASGWLAFTGRESNPLDRNERFQSYIRPPFQGLPWR